MSKIPALVEASNVSLSLVKKLLNAKADPNEVTMYKGYGHNTFSLTLISMFYRNNYDGKIIESMLKAKADPNIPNEFGHSPIYGAIKTSNFSLVKMLVKYGARPNPSIINTPYTPGSIDLNILNWIRLNANFDEK